jgi:aspartate/methionine/tyrosine aminotransferase
MSRLAAQHGAINLAQGFPNFAAPEILKEAAARGVNYLYNAVRPTHPDRVGVTRWLESRGFQPSGDGLLKRRVRP